MTLSETSFAKKIWFLLGLVKSLYEHQVELRLMYFKMIIRSKYKNPTEFPMVQLKLELNKPMTL